MRAKPKIGTKLPPSCPLDRPRTEFSDWEGLTLQGGSELDRALKWLARKFSSIVLHKHPFDTDMRDFLNAVEFYSQPDLLSRPEEFYVRPRQLPAVTLAQPHALSEGEVVDISFPTEFEPHYKPFREEFTQYPENQTVHARMWRHPNSVGQVIAIHGWFMGDQRVNALALVPGFFFRLGLDVVLYELPYHGRRTPQDAARNAKTLFPSMHVARTNESMAQAIQELRALRNWLEVENDLPVGVVGMSLGGYVAALWASLDKLAFVLPMVPLVSMAEIAWGVIQKNAVLSAPNSPVAGFDEQRLRDIYRIHSPLAYQPRVNQRRRMIVAGLGDSMIPPAQPHLLWEHWAKPRIHWFPGGHLSQLGGGNAFKEVHQFLLSLGLAREQMLSISGSSE